jgi:hypothetical protein
LRDPLVLSNSLLSSLPPVSNAVASDATNP